MMTRRDGIRKTDPTSPELPILNKDIQNRIRVHTQQKCRYFVGTMDQKTAYQTVDNYKGIYGNVRRPSENEAITFNGSS